jgi:uncharacterized cupin superfamily protein
MDAVQEVGWRCTRGTWNSGMQHLIAIETMLLSGSLILAAEQGSSVIS